MILNNKSVYNTVIVAKVTSALREDDYSFELNNQKLRKPLIKDSEIRLNELFTIHESLIFKSISSLTPKTISKLLTEIKSLF